ncbi:hypothetical protein FRB91_006590 [Serendipita sp. 411]|nr:hypothetical protein FRB91_006590 [Serendipita sp. 411]KAG9052006.1 hypothetical protein FS842_010637 [Serendipita sp. 407]
MDYPTFGGDEGRIQLCVQSLNCKGDLARSNDRHKVLINRTPKRHRSITAINFFAKPQLEEAPPVPPMPTPQVTTRPPPRFLEIFTPLGDSDSPGLSSSSVSTPSTSKTSLPVTPASPRRELGLDKERTTCQSYFLLEPFHTREQHPVALLSSAERVEPSASDRWPEEETDFPDAANTMHSDRSISWALHEDHKVTSLTMDGTFGRA